MSVSDGGPYLGSEQHVVHQLHIRLHLCPLNVIQVVAQGVTLEKNKNNLTKNLPVLGWHHSSSGITHYSVLYLCFGELYYGAEF